jgi:hypothetical protein
MLLRAPEPEAGQPVSFRTDRWTSRLDNPRMQGDLSLRSDEYALVNNLAYQFNRFDVTARSRYPSPPTIHQLAFPLVTTNGEANLDWRSRGMLLPRRITGASDEGLVQFSLWYDPSDPSTDLYQLTDEATVQLHSNVIVVPVHFIHIYSPASANFDIITYDEAAAAAILDDVWTARRMPNTAPGFSPDTVTYEWQGRGDDYVSRPDPVWTQCDIQFRLVNYSVCSVAANVVDAPPGAEGCGGNATLGRSNAMLTAVQSCIGNKKGYKLLVGGELDGPTCNPNIGGTASVGGTVAFIENASGKSNNRTVSHEIGHSLGLIHTTTAGRLMLDTYTPGATLLSSAECSKARSRAQALQSEWP